jgi:hypothetical protein
LRQVINTPCLAGESSRGFLAVNLARLFVLLNVCTSSVVMIQYILIESILNSVKSDELLCHKIKYNIKVVVGTFSKRATSCECSSS